MRTGPLAAKPSPAASHPTIDEPRRVPALTSENVEHAIRTLKGQGQLSAVEEERVRQAALNHTEKWSLSAALRGKVSHALQGQNTPWNTQVVDVMEFTPDGKLGKIVSLKSHQPYAESLRQPEGFQKALMREIDEIAGVRKVKIIGRNVDTTPNTMRVLQVEIPPDTIAAEMVGRPKGDPALRAQFRRESAAASEYANSRGVELRFVEARK